VDKSSDKAFVGSIPQTYEAYLVPLIFEPYAADLAQRLRTRSPSRVLELAAGTGVVTRAIATTLPDSVTIVASDLNRAMIDCAAARGTDRPVEWCCADAMTLPFDDGAFDAVVCQFGVMFFPDRSNAFSQARRVLKRGGVLLFNVWDRIEENDFAATVTSALAGHFRDDPPRFLPRIAHGYFDIQSIERDLRAAGFSAPPQVTTVAARSRASSPRIPAIAYCQGTPLRNEIEARDPAILDKATDAAQQAVRERFGAGVVDGKIQAHIVSVER
jgi:ubiquinone/menaquinone biosynthesis C-methylase UbiE